MSGGDEDKPLHEFMSADQFVRTFNAGVDAERKRILELIHARWQSGDNALDNDANAVLEALIEEIGPA